MNGTRGVAAEIANAFPRKMSIEDVEDLKRFKSPSTSSNGGESTTSTSSSNGKSPTKSPSGLSTPGGGCGGSCSCETEPLCPLGLTEFICGETKANSKMRKEAIVKLTKQFDESLGLTALDYDKFGCTITNFFRSHCIDCLIPISAKQIVLHHDLNIRKAIYCIIENGLRTGLITDGHGITGVLTVTDFIVLLIKCMDSSVDQVDLILDRCAIRDFHKKPHLIYIFNTATIFEALKLLNDYKIHRLPIVEIETMDVIGIATHKRILKYYYMNTEFFKNPPPCFIKHLNAMTIGHYEDVRCVYPSTTLGEMLRLFSETSLTSFPIVNETDGSLISMFTKFDIVFCVRHRCYTNFSLTLSDFMAMRAKASPSGIYQKPVTVQQSFLFVDVVKVFVSKAVRRVVVVDDQNHVKGIISLSDILDSLLHDELTKLASKATKVANEAMDVTF